MGLQDYTLKLTLTDGDVVFKTLPKTDENHIMNSVYVTLSVAKKDDFLRVDGSVLIKYSDIKRVQVIETEVIYAKFPCD